MKWDELCEEYRKEQSLYREFSERIAGIVRAALEDAGIKAYSISFREKDVEKLREKLHRKEAEGKPYASLRDVEDLAGIRVVAYLESQKEEMTGLIYGAFESARPRVEPKYDPEGYRGTHFVLSLDDERLKMTEYRRYKGLKCEIQVASILYHAWSEIEHDVIYKPGADREKLKSLGLDDIEAAFKKIMAQHLEEATIQFDLLYKKHRDVLQAGKVIYSDYIADIQNAESNDYIASLLSVVDKFSHKKPEEVVQMVEETIKRPALEPKVLHKFGDRDLLGKTHENLLEKCIEILKHFHVRYWNTERVLASLFALSVHSTKHIATLAMEAIKATVKYDHGFVSRYKNLYPQITALESLRKIPVADRKGLIPTIEVVAREILSLEVEGTEWSSDDTVTFRSGAMVPNDELKKLRQDTLDFLVELYKAMPDTAARLPLMRALLTALSVPFNTVYSDEVANMIQEDSKKLAGILTDLLYPSGTISNYLLAQEAEGALIQLLRGERLKNAEITALYERLLKDTEYNQFSTLVGDIQEFRNLDEEWDVAEARRTAEIDALVGIISEANLPEWYKRLNDFATPLKEGLIEEWKYTSFNAFISRLTSQKKALAGELFTRALNADDPLNSDVFVTPYLSTLRRESNIEEWDAFVELVKAKKAAAILRSLVLSLNLNLGADLTKQIRPEDVAILQALVRGEEPFAFAGNDDWALRHHLINTLTRLFSLDPTRFEALIIEEIKSHEKQLNIYFKQLPYASIRKWMSFKKWSPEGITFIKEALTRLNELDWHVQGMMLDLGEDPIELVLDVFKQRSHHKKDALGERYEEIPYHFNPELQKYLAGHQKYPEEMVKWLREMTAEWSTYNWHVTHFIQRIGGASYSSILMKLIENGDDESLKRAAHALRAFEGADFNLCMEIVARTDNKEILAEIDAAMSGTGVVSGENGLALAYEAKAKELEPFVTSENKRVSDFAAKTKKTLEQRAKSELERSATRTKTRKIEFGNS